MRGMFALFAVVWGCLGVVYADEVNVETTLSTFVRSRPLCRYDAVLVNATLASANEWVEVWSGTSMVGRLEHAKAVKRVLSWDSDAVLGDGEGSVLRCVTEEPVASCDVRLNAAWRVNVSALALQFDSETAMPSVSDVRDLISFSSELWSSSEVLGEWTLPNTLVVVRKEDNSSAVDAQGNDGDADDDSQEISLMRLPRESLVKEYRRKAFESMERAGPESVHLAFRFPTVGERVAVGCRAVLEGKEGRICGGGGVVKETTISVQECGESDDVDMWRMESVGEKEEKKGARGAVVVFEEEGEGEEENVATGVEMDEKSTDLVQRYWRMEPGVLSFRDGLELPSVALPRAANGEEAGNWSVCLWVHLFGTVDDRHSTIFFKGFGTEQHRTPSMWLPPGSTRPILRVSQPGQWDSGGSGTQDIAVGRWSHMCVSLVNGSEHFEYRWLVDGRVATSMVLRGAVLANAGSLYVGRDPTFGGAWGLFGDVGVFDFAVGVEEARRMFKSGPPENSLGLVTLAALDVATAAAMAAERREEDMSVAPGSVGLRDRAEEMWGDCAVGVESVQEMLSSACAEGHGDLEACHRLGRMLLFPGRVECDGEVEHLAALGQRADVATLSSLHSAVPLRQGTKARRILERAAVRGHCEAMYELSWLTVFGVGAGGTHAGGIPALAGSGLLMDESPGSTVLERANWDVSNAWLYRASACGSAAASFALAERRMNFEGKKDVVAAAQYRTAAVKAYAHYNRHGAQPLHERDRLTDDSVDIVLRGQGEDDMLIAAQEARAEDGDAAAQFAHGDLYYWGARGLPRDQVRARDYFERAAAQGHPDAMAAAAGMMVRGEGGERDYTRALELYQRAADRNSTRARNGLGFLHYLGQGGLEPNATKALELFMSAADGDGTGDALYNAAQCQLDLQNRSDARRLLIRAVSEKAHFAAAFDVGRMMLRADAGPWDIPSACNTLSHAAKLGGPWGALFRHGFDRYRLRDYTGAALLYMETFASASELGAANAAYLLRRRLADLHLVDATPTSAALEFVAEVDARAKLTNTLDKKTWASKALLPHKTHLLNTFHLLDHSQTTKLLQQPRALEPTSSTMLRDQVDDSSGNRLGAVSPSNVSILALARRLYGHSSDLGVPESRRPYADLLARGEGGPRDTLRAVALYAKASASGDPAAAFALGALFERGQAPLVRSEARAQRYYQRCLELAKNEAIGGEATHFAVAIALGRLAVARSLRSLGLDSVADALLQATDGTESLSEKMAKWALAPRSETEHHPAPQTDEDADTPLFSASSYTPTVQDVPDDEADLVGTYRGRVASIRWIGNQIASNLLQRALHDYEWIAILALLALLLILMLTRCIRNTCCVSEPVDDFVL